MKLLNLNIYIYICILYVFMCMCVYRILSLDAEGLVSKNDGAQLLQQSLKYASFLVHQ